MVPDSAGIGRLTTSPEAASLYRCGVRCLLMDDVSVAVCAIAAAVAIDPTFALAHIALALLARTHRHPADALARVRDAALHARRSTPWERSHVDAVRAWLDGDRAAVRRHATTYPRDALVGALAAGRWAAPVHA